MNLGPWHVAKSAGVLYIDGEDSEHLIKKRLNNLTKNLKKQEKPFDILPSSRMTRLGQGSLNLMNPKDREKIYKFLESHQEYQLLILDNISALTPGRDELVKNGWDPINQWLLRLRFLNVAVLIIHHSGKDENRGPRGTSGMGDALDSIICLKRPGDYVNSEGARFIVDFAKNPRNLPIGVDINPFEFAIKTDNDGYVWNTSEVKFENRDLVFKLLLENTLSQAEIARRVNLTDGRISHYKKEAVQLGLLSKDGKTITKNGKTWLENHLTVGVV